MNDQEGAVSIRIPGPVLYLLVLHAVIFLFTDSKINSQEHNYIMENWALCWKNIQEGSFRGLISYMFLHADIEHFINNMLMLYVVGAIAEKKLNTVKFISVYLLSGISGGAFSAFHFMRSGNVVYSIGASAAVFGIVGASAAIILKDKRYGRIDFRKILLLIFVSLYGGFTAENVDNMGHIGGLIFGFVFTLIIYRTHNTKMSQNIEMR